MMSKDEILYILAELQSSPMLEDIRVGLAGSFSRGEQTKDSDIDVVLDTDVLEKSANIELLKYIWNFLDSKFSENYDLLWLHLLREEDGELDGFCKRLGMDDNEYSVYKNICKDVIWCK